MLGERSGRMWSPANNTPPATSKRQTCPGEWPGVHSTRRRCRPISTSSAPSSWTEGSAVLTTWLNARCELLSASASSSNGIGRRSSKTPCATSVSARSVSTSALSGRRLTWVLASRRFRQEGTMSDTQMTPDQIVEAMPNFLIPEKAGTTKATIAFDLSGDHAGKWWVKIHDGAAESGKGDPADPANLTLQADSNDWV